MTYIYQWWAQGTTDSVVALAKSNSKNLFVKNERQGTWAYVFFGILFSSIPLHLVFAFVIMTGNRLFFFHVHGKPGDYAFNSTLSPFRVWLAFSNHRSRWRCIVPLRNDWKIMKNHPSPDHAGVIKLPILGGSNNVNLWQFSGNPLIKVNCLGW